MNVQDLVTVSLDRVIGDRVPVEPVEAYAVLQFVWEQFRASRDGDGRMMPLPALDALAISATGDIDTMRRAGEVSRTMRPPHEVAQELGHLLGQLLSSGGPDQPVSRPPASTRSAGWRCASRSRGDFGPLPHRRRSSRRSKPSARATRSPRAPRCLLAGCNQPRTARPTSEGRAFHVNPTPAHRTGGRARSTGRGRTSPALRCHGRTGPGASGPDLAHASRPTGPGDLTRSTVACRVVTMSLAVLGMMPG